MKQRFVLLLLLVLLFAPGAAAQYRFLTGAPAGERLRLLWRHCYDNFISDRDSIVTDRFLLGVEKVADNLGDEGLKKYAQYFRRCSRILFSTRYEQYFAKGDFETPASVFKRARAWALQEGHTDIAASCEHYIGQIYFHAARYGLAFEHLVKANNAFRKLGYGNVPAIATYLSEIGVNYYRFEEWDQALYYLLDASQYSFFLPWLELNTLNTIGLIYAKKEQWQNAAAFYRRTAMRASSYKDTTWVGIAYGNLGNAFLEKGIADSALFYHRQNWYVNNPNINPRGRAPEDAAKSALAIAAVFIQKRQPDSALSYIHRGQQLANQYINYGAEKLEYRKRLLTVTANLLKQQGDYAAALRISDSITIIKDSLRKLLDGKMINRATEKAEAERYGAEIKLLETEKAISRLRVYVLSGVLLISLLTGGLLFNRYRVRKRRQELWAQKENELLSVEKVRAEEKLRHSEELLRAYLATIREKTDLINSMSVELDRLKETTGNDDHLRTVASNMEKLFSATILTDGDWLHFRGLFEQVHPGFLSRLMAKFPELSPAETRLLILTKLALSSRDMANMLGISVDAIRKLRYRLRKKLNMEREEAFEKAIVEL